MSRVKRVDGLKAESGFRHLGKIVLIQRTPVNDFLTLSVPFGRLLRTSSIKTVAGRLALVFRKRLPAYWLVPPSTFRYHRRLKEST